MLKHLQEQIDQHNQDRRYSEVDFDTLSNYLFKYRPTQEEKNSDILIPVDFLLELIEEAYNNGYHHGASW